MCPDRKLKRLLKKKKRKQTSSEDKKRHGFICKVMSFLLLLFSFMNCSFYFVFFLLTMIFL